MARSLTAGTLAQLSQGKVAVALFVEVDFADATSYLWSGLGPIAWNAHTWLGVGKFGKVSDVTERTGVQADGITLTLSGVPQDMLDEALLQCRQGRPVKVWFGFLDAAGAVIADPYQTFAGRMDVPIIDEGAETATVSITVENRLIDLQRSRERRYTDDDQKIDYPTDRGFEYVASLQEQNLVWGKGQAVASGGGNRGPIGRGPGDEGGGLPPRVGE